MVARRRGSLSTHKAEEVEDVGVYRGRFEHVLSLPLIPMESL